MKDTNWFIDLLEDPRFAVLCLMIVTGLIIWLILWLLLN